MAKDTSHMLWFLGRELEGRYTYNILIENSRERNFGEEIYLFTRVIRVRDKSVEIYRQRLIAIEEQLLKSGRVNDVMWTAPLVTNIK